MSPLVFRTKKGGDDVWIPDVGQAPADAGGVLSVEDAARSLQELQTDKGEPLTGAKLKSAAEQFATNRGLDLVELQQETIDRLGQAEEPPAAAEEEK